MSSFIFPASIVPAGVSVAFTADHDGYSWFRAVDGGKVYRGMVDARGVSSMSVEYVAATRSYGFADGGEARRSRHVSSAHKLALRAVIRAAYAHATRGADMGVQHDMHVERMLNARTAATCDLSGLCNVEPAEAAELRATINADCDRFRHLDAGRDHVERRALLDTPAYRAHVALCSAVEARANAAPIIPAQKRETPVPAPRKPVVARGLASLGLALAIAAASPSRAAADPVNLPLPSNAQLHAAKLEMPARAATVRARMGRFLRGMHYEGRGEWNCSERLCDKLLKANGLTWGEVRAAWTGRAIPLPPVHGAAMAVRFPAVAPLPPVSRDLPARRMAATVAP